MTIPVGRWLWFGHAGHFVASRSCAFRLHTRVGDYRISTVGDYQPDPSQDIKDIGVGRTHETFVFRVTGPGEGEPVDWSEIDTDVYTNCDAALLGHMAMCRKYAREAA